MKYDKPRILVIGDKCSDHYAYGNVERLCPDVPAPVFKPIKNILTDGMDDWKMPIKGKIPY